jgi:GNAT superfamily N-acetyltransferase
VANIRRATIGDLATLVEMGRAMQQESPRFSRFDFDDGKVQQLITMLIDLDGPGCALVATVDETIVGMLGGILVEHFFGHDTYATDLVVFVYPAHRGGTTVVRLVKVFEEWARSRGALECCMGVSTELASTRVSALYRALGYRMAGYSHLKDL